MGFAAMILVLVMVVAVVLVMLMVSIVIHLSGEYNTAWVAKHRVYT